MRVLVIDMDADIGDKPATVMSRTEFSLLRTGVRFASSTARPSMRAGVGA